MNQLIETSGPICSRMADQSVNLGDLFVALSKAQGEMHAPVKDVWEACRKPLANHSLCISQWPIEGGDGTIAIYTLLGHESGQWIEFGPLSIPMANQLLTN